MADASGTSVAGESAAGFLTGHTTTGAACRFSWCAGSFCSGSDLGEAFHYAKVSSVGTGEAVGVELVSNDFADGATTGPMVDITFTDIASSGVSTHSASLSPLAALRHGEAVIRAAVAAISAEALK